MGKSAGTVIRPVVIEGFLARVEPGTRFELEKMPVAGDIWLPSPSEEDETYYGYHKAWPAQADHGY